MRIRTMCWSFLGVATIALACSSLCSAETPQNDRAEAKRPNIIFVLTDDQGYEDVGFHGNERVKTPRLDEFAQEGVDLTHFYVTPVCSTTRAGCLTGRYHYRTGVTNVGSCGDRIKASEVTIAEALQQAGYATAIFGKWHLGDNYPMRPQDNGFQEAVVHKECCLTPWFRPDGRNYFDPFLFHNGVKQQYQGYCMDVYTDLAMEFAEQNRDQPFFIYLSTNTPHTPIVVDDKYSEPYRAMGLDRKVAEYYGTITNIDENFGRLMDKLEELDLAENTLVVFLTDNGPISSQPDFSLKLRGGKSSVYEGGIRVPCVFRWPEDFKGGERIDRIASYIDLMPTFLDAAGVGVPERVELDGESLMPLLRNPASDWPDRSLIIQWHQGLVPEILRAFAVRNQQYKLVQAQGNQAGTFPANERKFELYDIAADPCETNDHSTEHPQLVAKMKQQYEEWFREVMESHGGEPQRIHIGSPQENPARLMASGSYVNQNVSPSIVTGQWPSRVLRSGDYKVKFVFHGGLRSSGILQFKFGDVNLEKQVEEGIPEYTFEDIRLKEGAGSLEAFVETSGKRIVPTYLDVELKGD